MFAFLKPPPAREPLPKEKLDPSYRRLRAQVFLGIFIGYAGYYLVRKNFSLAMPYLVEEGFSKADLGWALSALSIAYGLSKFLMGSVSDRSNARVFLPLGLLLSAGITAFMGFSPWALGSISVMFALLFVNGWVQGMGWPPCGRVMVHWFSAKERGMGMAVWNVAHNIGGGLVASLAVWGMHIFSEDWRSIFYFPAASAALVALFAFFTIRDTPQSCGLPPIETYKNDRAKDYSEAHEREFSARQIFLDYVLNNRALWMIAFANVFIYFVRYGVLDWAPTYLKGVKDFDFKQMGWAYSFYEFAGIPGTLLCGYISDKIFHGRRAPVTMIYMALTLLMVIVYWKNPAGNPWLDTFALIAIGFLIYGPVMMIGLQALDMVPKKAAGTAAGFTGLFGYLGGAVFANIIMGYTIEHAGWDASFCLLIAACALTMFIMIFSWREELKK